MSNIVEEITRRTYRYYYEDGLVEIAIGGMFAFFGLALYLFQQTLQKSPYAWLLGILLPVMTIAGAFGVKKLVTMLKERVTYPRTGSVIYKDQPTNGRWLLLVSLAAFVLIGLFLPESYTAAPMMEGILLAAILLFMGWRVRLARLQAAAIVPLAAGVLSGYLALGDLTGSVLVFGLTGLELLLFGAFALTGYLRDNPAGEEEER